MQFFSLFTPAVASSGPPDAAHMAKMGKLTEDMTKAGVLVTTGGILSRNTGMKVVRDNGTFTVEDGPVSLLIGSCNDVASDGAFTNAPYIQSSDT